MDYSENNNNEKPIIIIDEKPEIIPGQTEGETPVITIEDDEKQEETGTVTIIRRRRWPWIVGSTVVTALLIFIALFGYRYYNKYINIGVPVSVKSAENIAKLQTPVKKERAEVVMTSDSILGVSFNLYELRGLKAELSYERPDSADTDVYLYSRSCDFTSYDPKTNECIGSVVVDGKEIRTDVSRLGYCAMANDNVVIGIARDEKVKDYCIEQKGSFFRQFILVSDGVLPQRFFLHGKVERRALGRIDNKLYYIESRNKEAMWAFADALREYGFIDVIYITGGDEYSYYRDADGKYHDIGDVAKRYLKHKGEGLFPWLVFKKIN